MVKQLDERLREKLNEANKLIFIQRYADADLALAQLVAEHPNAGLLIHLRRIELALIVKNFSELRRFYQKAQKENRMTEQDIATCLAFLNLFEENADNSQSLERFREIMDQFGEDAACYYGIGLCLDNLGNTERSLYNYEQSLKLDHTWHPSYFGLSQIYYNKEDRDQGDHYFFLFERYAPYNLYGNFTTHRKLAEEFIQRGLFSDARRAMSILREWWFENKGACPPEVRLVETLIQLKITKIQEAATSTEYLKDILAESMTLIVERSNPYKDSHVQNILAMSEIIADSFSEEWGYGLIYQFLEKANYQKDIVHKIGSVFLSKNLPQLAYEIFKKSYALNIDSDDLRFGILVAQLNQEGIDVERHLLSKDRAKVLLESKPQSQDALHLLQSINSSFNKDPDIHALLGDVFFATGKLKNAEEHYQIMYDLDPDFAPHLVRYLSFFLKTDDLEKVEKILKNYKNKKRNKEYEFSDLLKIEIDLFIRTARYSEALQILEKKITKNPWDLDFLKSYIFSLLNIAYANDKKIITLFVNYVNLENRIEKNIDSLLDILVKDHRYHEAYVLTKLNYIFSHGNEASLSRVFMAARNHDIKKGVRDILALLNTNFDSAHLWVTIGLFYKEMWLLETSKEWFELVLEKFELDEQKRLSLYIELADCMIILGQNLDRVFDYLAICDDPKFPEYERVCILLGHAYATIGKLQKAKTYLDRISSPEFIFERDFLLGLLDYKSHYLNEAKEKWKPLIKSQNDNTVRHHHIKQLMLDFYFSEQNTWKGGFSDSYISSKRKI